MTRDVAVEIDALSAEHRHALKSKLGQLLDTQAKILGEPVGSRPDPLPEPSPETSVARQERLRPESQSLAPSARAQANVLPSGLAKRSVPTAAQVGDAAEANTLSDILLASTHSDILLESHGDASFRSSIPDFRPGDTVRVHLWVTESSQTRTQVFAGHVIRREGGGANETFTVRKVSFGVGVERTFPMDSPYLKSIEVVTRGDVRRAKLYYLRDLRGKAAKIKEKREKG